ncbi:MAG: heparan-alpha-glucosaminide N-acetyltransferase domain-containing protein [Desulfobacterales bacterium]|nr:heparan-alpha-glucosaminide N-acetyltransferase domain-containing protein [Desulfobacterales bacterium]
MDSARPYENPADGPSSYDAPSRRIAALDALRGTIMILMALDHASYFIARMHSREFWGTALPDYASALPFVLRATTHICAPGFFLLMGAGMAMLSEARRASGWTPARLSRFFLLRGLILIAAQLAIENPAWGLAFVRGVPGSFVSRGGPIPGSGEGLAIYLGVLFALGAAMLFWSLAGRLPAAAVAGVSLAALAATAWATPGPEAFGVDYPAWVRMLQIPGRSGIIVVFYPVIPWLGITGLGILLGRWARTMPQGLSGKALAAAGVLLAGFVILRSIGGFGNFHPPQAGWIGFLNVTKYPPSLVFILLSLGINALLLSLYTRWGGQGLAWLAVFGRSPFFFYVLHLYLFGLMGWFVPAGVSQVRMLLFWLAGLALLYPLCRWYGRFKAARPVTSIWRLL